MIKAPNRNILPNEKNTIANIAKTNPFLNSELIECILGKITDIIDHPSNGGTGIRLKINKTVFNTPPMKKN